MGLNPPLPCPGTGLHGLVGEIVNTVVIGKVMVVVIVVIVQVIVVGIVVVIVGGL